MVILYLWALTFGAASSEQLWVLDAEGREAYVFEVPGFRLIDTVVTGANPHGIAITADADRIFISNERLGEPEGELVWLDARTRVVEGRMWVGPEPHEIECSPDGRFVYVPTQIGWQVVEVASKTIIKTLVVKGRPHNTTLHPDGKHMYLSPLRPASEVTVVSLADHEIVGNIPFSAAPRPAAISRDGQLLYQNVDNLLGYEVAHLPDGALTRVEHQLLPDKKGIPSRIHGMALRPDQREAWTANLHHHTVHIHRTSDHKQTHVLRVDGGPYWISMSPDGAYAYISLPLERNDQRRLAYRLFFLGLLGLPGLLLWRTKRRGAMSKLGLALLLWSGLCFASVLGLYGYVKLAHGKVLVVDTQSKEVVEELDAGRVPKRTQTLVLPPRSNTNK